VNETFEGMSTVAAPDECPACLKYASEGYGEWYEMMPVTVATPLLVVPAVPEPSVWALLLLGILASRLFLRKRSVK